MLKKVLYHLTTFAIKACSAICLGIDVTDAPLMSMIIT